jgi:hypothetical protein
VNNHVSSGVHHRVNQTSLDQLDHLLPEYFKELHIDWYTPELPHRCMLSLVIPRLLPVIRRSIYVSSCCLLLSFSFIAVGFTGSVCSKAVDECDDDLLNVNFGVELRSRR